MTIRVSNVVTAYLCGKLGRAIVVDGLEIANNYAMQKGTDLHKKIELWANGLGAQPDGWGHLPDQREILRSELAMSREFDGVTVTGTADFSTADYLGEIKTGLPYEWHKLQVALYAHMAGFSRAKIFYPHTEFDPDNAIVIYENVAEGAIEIVKQAVENIKSGVPQKNEKCKWCSLKKSCSAWGADTGPIDDLIKNIELEAQIVAEESAVKAEIELIFGERLASIKTRLTEVNTDQKRLRNEVAQLDVGSRYVGPYTVTVYPVRTIRIPDDYATQRPYADYPELYLIEPNNKKMKYEIGISETVNQVRVTKKEKTL